MAFTLAPEAQAAGYRLIHHETIGSTSADAMERARDGERGPLWVVADRQSAGRGRRGSTWMTPPGNLAASLLLTTGLPPATIANLGFVAGVALVRALESLVRPSSAFPSPLAGEGGPRARPGDRMRGDPRRSAPDPSSDPASPGHLLPQGEKDNLRFTLKWPNDVLADGAKLSGIALETQEVWPGRAVVIGIGVNVAHAPEGLPYPVSSLATLGHDVAADDLFAALSAAWTGAFATWDGGRGFAAIRQAWLGRAAGLARPIAVRQGESVRRGLFETIDAHGHLVLRDESGIAHSVSAGDVHFHGAGTLRPGAAA